MMATASLSTLGTADSNYWVDAAFWARYETTKSPSSASSLRAVVAVAVVAVAERVCSHFAVLYEVKRCVFYAF